jgi:hypothetical protein
MNIELDEISAEVVVAYFYVLSRYSPRMTVKFLGTFCILEKERRGGQGGTCCIQ